MENDVRSREQRAQRRAARKKGQPEETESPVVAEGPVDMPDPDHLNQQINSLQEEIDSEKAKMENAKNALRQKDEERRQLRAQIEQIRTQLDESHKIIAAKQKEKEEPFSKLKKRDAERNEIEKIRKELPCDSLAKLEELITAIEQQMQRCSLSLKEEKKVLADIQKYKTLKDPIRQLEAKIAAFDKDKEEHEQYAAISRAVTVEVGVLRSKNQEIVNEFNQFRTAEGELVAEIKQLRNDIDAASAKIERAYQKIRDSRSKFREQAYQFQRQEKEKVFQKRVQDRTERQQRFNKADTSAVEDMLRRQRERLQDAGIKWNISTEASGNASTDTMDAPQIKFLLKPEKPTAEVKAAKQEDAVVPEVAQPKKGKPAEAAPPPPPPPAAASSEEEEEEVESPEEVKRRQAEEAAKRREEEARKRAEAEERKRKKEEIKRKKDAERAERERQKKEEKKQKKLGLKNAGTDTGGGTEDDAAAPSAGQDEKSAAESGADTSDAPTKLTQKERDNISRKERITKSVIAESRRRDEVAQKLRKRRNRLFGIIPMPKLPDWAWYLLAALLAIVLALIYAVVTKIRSAPSPIPPPLADILQRPPGDS